MLRHEGLARHRQHGIEDPDIGDVCGAHLTIDHLVARGRKTGHELTFGGPWKRGELQPAGAAKPRHL
jgi:hypothetical protein